MGVIVIVLYVGRIEALATGMITQLNGEQPGMIKLELRRAVQRMPRQSAAAVAGVLSRVAQRSQVRFLSPMATSCRRPGPADVLRRLPISVKPRVVRGDRPGSPACRRDR